MSIGNNLMKSGTYVASKYSHKIWTCIPKYRAYIVRASGTDNIRVYPTLVPEISWYACAVCRVAVDATSSGIHIQNTVESTDCYYIVPDFHLNCRELLRLNPLAYYEDA